MEIRAISDKKTYSAAVLSNKSAQFLQSWEWGEFLNKAAEETVRLAFFDEGKIFFALSLYKKRLVRKICYYTAPRVDLSGLDSGQLDFVFSEILKFLKKANALFLRIEPVTKISGWKFERRLKKTIDLEPSRTLVLDLGKSEAELLEGMHQKTRYNIKLAQKKKVLVEEYSADFFDDFWQLMKMTGGRDSFRLHKKEHYQKMLGISGSNAQIKLFVAKYEGKVLAANIIAFFGGWVTYVHGASSNEKRNVMAPYLLQWEVITRAKRQGYKFYDFFGIDDKKWPGVTRFKKGFGGEELEYPGTFDFVANPCWYRIYHAIRLLRRKLL